MFSNVTFELSFHLVVWPLVFQRDSRMLLGPWQERHHPLSSILS